MCFERLIWRLFFTLTIAEDPSKPLLFRNWARQEDSGRNQRDMFIEVARVTHKFQDGSKKKAWNIIVGPLSIWFSLIDKVTNE